MSEFVKTQQESRANLVMQIRETIDSAETEGRGLSGEELQKIDRIEQDITRADEAISVAQRSEERALEVAEAARGFEVAEAGEDSSELLRDMAIRGGSHVFNFEKRATLVPSVNTVPVDFLDRVYSIARLVGPMLETSEVITRSTGNDFRIPTLTAYSTAAQVDAGAAISDSEPTFSSVLLSPAKQAFIVKLANELVTDAGFDIEGVIAEQAGNAIGFRVNALATTGSGSGETEGIVTASAAGVTAASATDVTADELIELAYSIDGAARRLPGVGWMMNTNTLGEVRKLKDNDGRYLYDPVITGADTILGFPIFENPAMADTATTEKPVIFGHLPSYKLVTTGLEVATSADAYFANDVIGYRFTYRMDGKLTHAAHVKHIVMA